MQPESYRFWIFVLVSLMAFIAILHFVTRHRSARPRHATVLAVAAVVVIGGMVFAKYGHNAGPAVVDLLHGARTRDAVAAADRVQTARQRTRVVPGPGVSLVAGDPRRVLLPAGVEGVHAVYSGAVVAGVVGRVELRA